MTSIIKKAPLSVFIFIVMQVMNVSISTLCKYMFIETKLNPHCLNSLISYVNEKLLNTCTLIKSTNGAAIILHNFV